MTSKELKRRILLAQTGVLHDIADHAKQGHVAAGLANEGFNGGYLAALDDVLLLLTSNVTPNRFWWKQGSSGKKSE